MPARISHWPVYGLSIFTAVSLAYAQPASQPAEAAALLNACRELALQTPPPAPIEVRDLPMTLVDGPVNKWLGGNRLGTQGDRPRGLLPGSFVPGSLKITVEGSEKSPAVGTDFIVDDVWGAFGIKPGGMLKAGQKVKVSYQYTLRRVDTVVRNRRGRLRLLTGEPGPECAAIPAPRGAAQVVARIYRPFNAGELRDEQIYVVVPGEKVDLSPREPGPDLARVIAKLRAGGKVTVVCWGDSVTVGGSDAGPPGSRYSDLFEKRLKEMYPKASITLINAGIGGTSTLGRLPKFQEEVLDHHPDLVTLEFVNDMGLPVERMQPLYDEILSRTRASGAALLIMTPHFVMPAWMNLPHGRGGETRAGVQFLRAFAQKNGLPLADAAARWEQLERLGIPYEIYLRNGINHPDERGHLIFVEELMRFFAK